MQIQASFLKEYVENDQTIQQIEQIRSQLQFLIKNETGSLNALNELEQVNNQLNEILVKFNQLKDEKFAGLAIRSKLLKEAAKLINNLGTKYQETYSKKLINQLRYYAKCFDSLAKKMELVSFARSIERPSDRHLAELYRLTGEYLNMSWDIFPEDVIMYGALAKGLSQKNDSSLPLFLGSILNNFIEIAIDSSQKALNYLTKRKASQEAGKVLDNLIKQSNNIVEIEVLKKAKRNLQQYPSSIKLNSKNTIFFDATTLDEVEEIIEKSNEINLEASYQLALSNSLLSYIQYFQDIFTVFFATLKLYEEAIKFHEQTQEPLELVFYNDEDLIAYYELIEFKGISQAEIIENVDNLKMLVNSTCILLNEINENKINLNQQEELIQEFLRLLVQIINQYWDYIVPAEVKYYLLKLFEEKSFIDFFNIREFIISQSENDEDIEDIKKAQSAIEKYEVEGGISHQDLLAQFALEETS